MTAYTSPLFPALLFDWLITLILTLTLTLTLTIFDNIVLEKRAGSKSGAYVELYAILLRGTPRRLTLRATARK